MERKVNEVVFKTVEKEWDVYLDMALVMLDEIMKNNAQGKKTVMIVPVGPTDQYPILVSIFSRSNRYLAIRFTLCSRGDYTATSLFHSSCAYIAYRRN